MSRGHIHLERKIKNDPLWEPKRPRSKLEAWLDLCLRAKGRPGRELVGYSMIPLERGQLIYSIKGLAAEWKWNRDTVRRFLGTLEREGRIRVSRGCAGRASKPDTQSDTPYSIITICNYSKYNPLTKKSDTQSDTKPTPIRHPSDTSKKVRKKEGSREKDDHRPIESQSEDEEPQYSSVLLILHSIENWPIDAKTDDTMIQTVIEAHGLGLEQLEAVAHDLKVRYLDDPIKKGDRPRSRFKNYCRKRAEWDGESGRSDRARRDEQHDTVTASHIRHDLTSALIRAANGEMEFEQFEAVVLKRYEGKTVNPEAIQKAWDIGLEEFGESDAG